MHGPERGPRWLGTEAEQTGRVAFFQFGPANSRGHAYKTAFPVASFVVVTMAIHIQHILAVSFCESGDIAPQIHVAAVVAGSIRCPVTKGHNKGHGRVMLSLIHQSVRFHVPVRPCFWRVGFRVCDEPHVPVVEPRPILAAASKSWSARRCLGMGQSKPSLVVSQIIILLLVPFVISPRRHVRGVLRPGHHVVEVLIDGRLTIWICVGQIPQNQHHCRRLGDN